MIAWIAAAVSGDAWFVRSDALISSKAELISLVTDCNSDRERRGYNIDITHLQVGRGSANGYRIRLD